MLSANAHRRHLTGEQKRELIAKLIKADPTRSDRKIGDMIKTDHKTVGSVRAEREATGEISPVQKRVGKDGKARAQPAAKRRSEAEQHRAAAERLTKKQKREVMRVEIEQLASMLVKNAESARLLYDILYDDRNADALRNALGRGLGIDGHEIDAGAEDDDGGIPPFLRRTS